MGETKYTDKQISDLRDALGKSGVTLPENSEISLQLADSRLNMAGDSRINYGHSHTVTVPDNGAIGAQVGDAVRSTLVGADRVTSSATSTPIYNDVQYRPFEDSDIYTRLNGMMDGSGGIPLRPPTPFLRELAGLTRESEIIDLLGDKEKVSAIPNDGCVAQGIWKTASGNHIIKKVGANEEGYMPYARLAALRPDIPLMPRIDAIIEAQKYVYIVMEPLLKHTEIPADHPLRDRTKEWTPEELKTISGDLFGSNVGMHYFEGLIGSISQTMPSDVSQWAGYVKEIIHTTNAEVDCKDANIMFRANADGTYSPVITDPLVFGTPYNKISPTYLEGATNSEAFIWKVANRAPPPPRPRSVADNTNSKIAPGYPLSQATQPPTALDHPSDIHETKPQVHSEVLSPSLADSRLNMAGNHAMNLLGFVPVAISMGSDIEHGNVKGAITTGGSFAAVTAAPVVIAKIATLTKIAPVAKVAGLVGERAIPIVGSAFGAIQSGVEAHHDFATGHVARGWLDTVKAGAYGTAAVAGVATAADCWNPTVIAPALVTGGALTVGVAIDAGESVYAHSQGIVSGAKSMWNWATGGSGQTPQQAVTQKQARTETPDSTQLPASHTGRGAG
ncbi:MAG: hypothetical protein WCD70_03375, partial [Alphaproteobacteria bacterium]